MAKTVKEIADELGVDKQRVYRYIKRNCISEVLHEALQRNGVKYYDEAAVAQIKQGFSADSASDESLHEVHQNRITDAVSEAVIDMLRKELEIKNEQIRELNARLAESNAALVAAQQTAQAAQALHAGTIQQHFLSGETEDDEPKKVGWFSRWFRDGKN